MSALTAIRKFARRQFLYRGWVDWLLGAVVGVVAYRSLPVVLPKEQFAAYQTFAAISGTLLGLSITTVSLTLSRVNAPLNRFPDGLPSGAAQELMAVLFRLTKALGVLCLVAIVLILTTLAGKTWPFNPAALLAAGATTVTIRFARSIWLLTTMVKVQLAGPK